MVQVVAVVVVGGRELAIGAAGAHWLRGDPVPVTVAVPEVELAIGSVGLIGDGVATAGRTKAKELVRLARALKDAGVRRLDVVAVGGVWRCASAAAEGRQWPAHVAAAPGRRG